MKRTLLLLVNLISFQLFSQDYIFTNFNQTPMSLGPQFASSENESINVHGRAQGLFNEFNSTYKTYFISANKRIISDSSFALGIAPRVSLDKAGETSYKNNGFGVALAISKKLFKSSKSNHEISLGLDAMMVNSSLNEDDLRWPSQITSEGFNPNLPGENVIGLRYFNVNTGINLKSEFNIIEFDLGYTLFNVNTPSISLIGKNTSDKYIRRQLYFMASIELSKSFEIKPKYLFTSQGPHSNYIMGSDIAYNFNENTYAFIGGGIMKNGNYFSAGLSVNKFRLGVCYDIFNINDYYGAELNLAYKL